MIASRTVLTLDTTPMMNGISCPVDLISSTPVISETAMAFSMNEIKQPINVKTRTWNEIEKHFKDSLPSRNQ